MEPTKIVHELWDRMQARDWPGLTELLADDVVVEWPVSAEPCTGSDPSPQWRAAYVRPL